MTTQCDQVALSVPSHNGRMMFLLPLTVSHQELRLECREIHTSGRGKKTNISAFTHKPKLRDMCIKMPYTVSSTPSSSCNATFTVKHVTLSCCQKGPQEAPVPLSGFLCFTEPLFEMLEAYYASCALFSSLDCNCQVHECFMQTQL